MQSRTPHFLVEIPLLAPLLIGVLSTLILVVTAYRREAAEEKRYFEQPARFVQVQVSNRLRELTDVMQRSSLALYTVRDLPSERFMLATAPLRHAYPFILDIHREPRHAARPGDGVQVAGAHAIATAPAMPAEPQSGSSAVIDLLVADQDRHTSDTLDGEPGVTVFRLQLERMFSAVVAAAAQSAQSNSVVAVYGAASIAPQHLIFQSGTTPVQHWCASWWSGCRAHRLQQTLTWAGRPWHISVSAPRQPFWTIHAGSTGLLILGVLATGFGVALIGALQQRTRRVIDLVHLRTNELHALNQILLHDIEQRKAAHQELNSSKAQLRSLIDHNARIKEDERKRIARELHDDLGQSLMALKMDLTCMLNGAPAELRKEQLTVALAQIDATVGAMRLIINELRPVVLDLGLDAAVEWEANKYTRRTGIACAVSTIPVDPSVISDETSTALYRIVQESLTNIMRHAKATRVTIDLRREADWLFLTITDNGVGMHPDSRRKTQSFGLLGISERIYTLGGAFDVASSAETGTTLSIAVPCAPPARTAAPGSL
jgi:signal transduction histidine kinase